jgi:hypothetical protein
MAYTDNGFADNYDNAIHFSDENADGLSFQPSLFRSITVLKGPYLLFTIKV